jgi:hypothetical protein
MDAAMQSTPAGCRASLPIDFFGHSRTLERSAGTCYEAVHDTRAWTPRISSQQRQRDENFWADWGNALKARTGDLGIFTLCGHGVGFGIFTPCNRAVWCYGRWVLTRELGHPRDCHDQDYNLAIAMGGSRVLPMAYGVQIPALNIFPFVISRLMVSFSPLSMRLFLH